jgi:hypothetical protein
MYAGWINYTLFDKLFFWVVPCSICIPIQHGTARKVISSKSALEPLLRLPFSHITVNASLGCSHRRRCCCCCNEKIKTLHAWSAYAAASTFSSSRMVMKVFKSTLSLLVFCALLPAAAGCPVCLAGAFFFPSSSLYSTNFNAVFDSKLSHLFSRRWSV